MAISTQEMSRSSKPSCATSVKVADVPPGPRVTTQLAKPAGAGDEEGVVDRPVCERELEFPALTPGLIVHRVDVAVGVDYLQWR